MNKPLVIKALRRAAERVTPGTWTQGSMARTERGFAVGTSDRRACKFCAIGHIDVASDEVSGGAIKTHIAGDGPAPRSQELDAISAVRRSARAVTEQWLRHHKQQCLGGSLAAWNDVDYRTVEDVKEALNGAADELEKQGVSA